MRKKFFWMLFVVLAIGIFKYKSKEYTINISRSLPPGIYKLEEIEEIMVGDIVQFRLEEEQMNFLYQRGYLPAFADTLLKIVAADHTNTNEITIQYDTIFPMLYIKNKNWGPILPVDSKNRVVPQISLEKIKPKRGEYLLLSPVNRSFDGRYWGVVKRENILKKAIPVFSF